MTQFSYALAIVASCDVGYVSLVSSAGWASEPGQVPIS